MGDESVAVGTPHGNAKSNDRIFYCTCPSVLKKIAEEMSHQNIFAKNIFLEVILHSNISIHYSPTMGQKKVKREDFLTIHTSYNIHEGAYDLESFLKVIMMYSDLIVVYGHEEILKELNSLLQVDSIEPQLLSYYDNISAR